MAYKNPTAATLKKEMTGNKMFGALAPKKMTPAQVAKRKRTTLSNAAHKTFNTNYSK